MSGTSQHIENSSTDDMVYICVGCLSVSACNVVCCVNKTGFML